MKIFYAVQATGNGHISRCMELLPYLQQYGQVDIFLSGGNSQLRLEAPIKYRSRGLSLFYSCHGGLNYWKTAWSVNPVYLRRQISHLPVEEYDLILNDYDYLTAAACRLKNLRSIHFGHQASFQSLQVPRPPQISRTGEWLLKRFAPAEQYLGLHFKPYDDFILPPVIKKEILEAQPRDQGHITVYLPSYCQRQLWQLFSGLKDFKFHIFSIYHAQSSRQDNICWMPVDRRLFNSSLINCRGLIAGAGFETPAEALHLGKQLLAIPIRGQYEQCCNAAALQQMGVMTLDVAGRDFPLQFKKWMRDYTPLQVDYSRTVPQIMQRLFRT
ncbi:glycosyltransferase family protein [Niabella terrae]